MFLEAQGILEKGDDVILDATFANRRKRDEARQLAADADANVLFIECVCPEHVLRRRLRVREAEGGLSQARLEHLEDFQQHYSPPQEVPAGSRIRIRTDGPVADSLSDILTSDAYQMRAS